MTFRLMTYNVHACRGQRGVLSLERVASAIAEQSPDVVALQEVDVLRMRSGRAHQPRELAAALGMHWSFGTAMRWDEAHYGNAILSRFPLEVTHSALLPRPRGWPVEPRNALAVHIGEIDVTLINTHLGLLAFERMAQIRALLGKSWLGGMPRPLMLCGDLNAWPASRELKLLRTHLHEALPPLDHAPRRLRLPRPGPTNSFPVGLPLWRLDHVLHTSELTMRRFDVPRTALTRQASDHLPVVVDFERADTIS